MVLLLRARLVVFFRFGWIVVVVFVAAEWLGACWLELAVARVVWVLICGCSLWLVRWFGDFCGCTYVVWFYVLLC